LKKKPGFETVVASVTVTPPGKVEPIGGRMPMQTKRPGIRGSARLATRWVHGGPTVSEEKVFQLVVDIIRSEVESVGDRPIRLHSRLVEELGFDSLDLVGVVMGLQDRLHIPIGVQEIKEFASVADIVAAVQGHLRASAA
jgi:acyl carrier protein